MLTAPGEPEVDVIPVPGARLQPDFTSEIDATSLVEGVLRLADASTGLEASRFPRRVVTFRHDDLLNAYIECERVQLGEDSLLLVKDDKNLPESVRTVLTQIARPGFSRGTRVPRPARRLGAVRGRPGHEGTRAGAVYHRSQRTYATVVGPARVR